MDKPEDVAGHLARNLISLRHARSLTQGALASVADLPRSTVANLESGDGNPSLAVLLKVAAALGTPPHWGHPSKSYSRPRMQKCGNGTRRTSQAK